MPPVGWIGPIGETGTVMQLRMVVDELHVARLKPHSQMQIRIISQCIEHVQRRHMFQRQAHGIVKPLGAINILALIENRKLVCMP